jgi:multicomponent Na+:H+ antiporter subunit B
MNSLIFRTIAPIIVAIMVVFSVFVLLRGHNEPGGGFIGGLIAASGIAIFTMATDVGTVRRALRFDLLSYAGFGVLISSVAGLLSLTYEVPFLTGLWTSFDLGEGAIALSTPMLFDIGVYFVVFGVVGTIALALQDEGEVD